MGGGFHLANRWQWLEMRSKRGQYRFLFYRIGIIIIVDIKWRDCSLSMRRGVIFFDFWVPFPRRRKRITKYPAIPLLLHEPIWMEYFSCLNSEWLLVDSWEPSIEKIGAIDDCIEDKSLASTSRSNGATVSAMICAVGAGHSWLQLFNQQQHCQGRKILKTGENNLDKKASFRLDPQGSAYNEVFILKLTIEALNI